MQGTYQMVVDDVRGIGKSIGVKFKGDNSNMFNVLSRAGKGKKRGAEKRKEVRKLVGEKLPFVVCLQETKTHFCDDALVSSLWEVEVWSPFSSDHILVCRGRFISSNDEFVVVNVYAPCDPGSKQVLWDSLFVRLQSLVGLRVCVSGDFNASWWRVRKTWGPLPLRMWKCWKDIPSYDLFVREKWHSLQVDGWRRFVLKEKLRMIKVALKEWHVSHTANLPGRIDSLKTRLSELDKKGEVEEVHEITTDLHLLSRLHASISWHQSRSLWLKEGDANSKYFHLDSYMERPWVNNLQFKLLTWLDRGSLTKPFIVEEVKVAVWDCGSFKSLGLDGINPSFFKDLRAELQVDIMQFVSEFHRNGRLAKGLNSTFIALIPKVDSPQRLNDFRPISLVGSLYKILAKVLANRLRLVIRSVVSETQATFVKDRQILDGNLIANEVVDEARKAKKELLLFKECVHTATAPVLVNGSPTDEFPLDRGLRQGDPLSPFLFLIAAEGLNVLMRALVENNLFTGYSVGVQDPISVSHLQFTDDTLLMGVKSWANVCAMRAVLVLFELMSGLKMNFNKSLLVGVNIPDSWLYETASSLGCKVGNIPFLYLGLPIGGDPRRLRFCEDIRKISWINWKIICMRKEFGGLRVRKLTEFNVALLGQLREGRDRGSSWWREIVKIREGVGGLGGGWFRESVVKRVGVGATTFFWTDPWLGGIPLCERLGGGVGVKEATMGVEGGDVGGVSYLTFEFLFSGSVSRCLVVAARPGSRLFNSRSLPDFDFPVSSYFVSS
ncbi:hypothetical protein TSUD_133700 [Trifolium subterraneum]|uniref:Reverse transcriptase domain-containing protein n=1 Tax=Trifolium subterraneum TaxID=3900 RepID=A0A2Z6PH33_TRISU|nr:hypothetical protein TSUD_133700 [Trifolium subterraneum]